MTGNVTDQSPSIVNFSVSITDEQYTFTCLVKCRYNNLDGTSFTTEFHVLKSIIDQMVAANTTKSQVWTWFTRNTTNINL